MIVAAALETHPTMQALADRLGTLGVLTLLCGRIDLAGDLLHLQGHLFGGMRLSDDAHLGVIVQLADIRLECAEHVCDAMRH